MNQRSGVRYYLRAPVIFGWQVGEHDWIQGAGFIRDVSTQGIYIMCERDERPATGAHVWFQIQLPSFEVKAEGVRIKASGTVVRIGSQHETSGFAISATIDMERAEEDFGNSLAS